ncbi:DEDD exnuclease domain-containing protein [Brachybacterium endophyticum]|uniref:DEDD exnuclease domain-containing protein n=1 Tax=Brachybacterium endophyticum TaxID=2182385 RepID=A0A2U2RJ25_9MICO|nr:DEDD exonuclease domain-containing protein [Brachybacterium endophyticum]PWH05863.1 DEDD exnuclease domain-containing protein [Brachybacterium endophyticum]
MTPSARRRQLSFGDLGTPLAEAEMVVVDLETTGTDPTQDAITEIGAVKVRAGEVLGEFRTFVDPQRPIPAYIASLTGISDATVRGAPTIATVLPMFLDFAHDAVLVAHNARFDVGFLRAQAARVEVTWPQPTVLDTLALARTVYRRDEVRDHKLGTLARHVGAQVTPDHRALSDARATVDVLHAIIERLGERGAQTVEDLASAHRRVTPAQARKRHLADTVPAVPGVYQFVDREGAVLYVGTSHDLRSRVRTYFSASETRKRVLDVIPRIHEVRSIECASRLEAAVRELRVIAREQPPANRHGLRPEKALWLRLGPGAEGLRAARIAREEADGSAQIGPLRSRHDVEGLRALLTDAVMGRGAALEGGGAGPRGKLEPGVHARIRALMLEDPSALVAHAAGRMRSHVRGHRYEDAARIRGVAETFLEAAARAQRLRALASCPMLVAARPAEPDRNPGGGWELLAVRRGRHVGTAIVPRGMDPVPVAHELARRGELVEDLPAGPLCHGHHQESELLLSWLSGEGMRIVQVEGTWSVPARARFDPQTLQAAFAAAD